MKDVWVEYEKYKELMIEEITRLTGQYNELSADTQMKKPHSMLQSIILIDILKELKKLNEKLETNSSSEVGKVEPKATRTTTKK